MDEYASAVASRRLWSKALQQKRRGGQLHRKEQTVSLPVLDRRGSGQQVGISTRNSSLHAFLTSQLETNDRESHSRSLLRAMTSSKLLSGSNNNVSSKPRIHTSVERLMPLDSASFETTRFKQRRPLPEPLQAAIHEVLAVRPKDDALSDREDTRTDSSSTYDVPETPKVKRSSPCKKQLPSRRPEWRRYIRRIMMTKGIRGSTLARYRRLVGIVARKNLNTSLIGAVERVVRYRLEFRSAVTIQQLIHRFVLRRRQVKQLQRHRAASKIQFVWRRIIAIEKQRKQHEMTRLAKIEELTRRSKARIIQQVYRAYQSTCRLREEQRRQLQQASMLQKARSKLLRRYQSWRKNATKRVLDQEPSNMPSDTPPDDHKCIVLEESPTSCEPEDVSPLASCSLVEATTTFSWITSDNLHRAETLTTPPELPYGELVDSIDSSSLGIQALNKTDDCLDELESTSISYQQSEQLAQRLENLTVSASTDNRVASDDGTPADLPIQSKPVDQLPCEDFYDQNPETMFLECSINAVPEDDRDIVDNNESAHDAPEGLLNSLDQVPILNILLSLDNVPDLVEGDTSESVAFAEAEARRSLAAKTIARYLKPKILSRHGIKTCSAVQIQCVIRSFLAKKSLVRVRLQKLHSLRVQLLASWNQLDHEASSSLVDKQHDQNAYEPDFDDDEDDFDEEMRGYYHPHIHSATDNYLHLLPTRNGQIPPGVPFLQSSVAVPVLSLWKWSWTSEQWVGNDQ